MEKLSDGHLARALERGRTYFNAAFANARSLNRDLDPEEFALHLSLVLDPIINAVGDAAPDKIDEVTRALYDLSIELFDQDCLGRKSHHPLIGEAWLDLLPKIPRIVAEDPTKVAASISNAVFTMSNEPGVQPRRWIDGMAAVAPLCADSDKFLEAGKAFAWRCGMAHYRESAVEVLKTLPEEIVYFVAGPIEKDDRLPVDELLKALEDPWKSIAKKADGNLSLSIVAEVGGFRGFGGQFIAPPKVTLKDGLLQAYDQEFRWTVHADRFGATLQRSGRDRPDADVEPPDDFTINTDGSVKWKGVSAKFASWGNLSSYALTETTLAVTLPRSHKIFLAAVV